MNRAAVEEMAAAGLAAVVVKGDLTDDGRDEEFAAFEACYRPAFGSRLHVVRGNHDAFRGQRDYAGDQWLELPGVAVALLDTTIPHAPSGHLSPEQLDWLDAGAAAATVPVLAMGHHQQWTEGERNPEYFGIDPDASDGLTAVISRRPAIVAYTAGHTHRHRVRPVDGGVPSIEVGCVKDFPGTWAEYRVYDGGILQVRPPRVVPGGVGVERGLPQSVCRLRRGLLPVRDGTHRTPVFRDRPALTDNLGAILLTGRFGRRFSRLLETDAPRSPTGGREQMT